MSESGELKILVEAASSCWDQIAAFAWGSYQLSGRGAVLVLAEDLQSAASSPEDQAGLPMNYFAQDAVPSGDDFRSLMGTYEPRTQVMLMIGGSTLGEQVFILEAKEGHRVRPDSFS